MGEAGAEMPAPGNRMGFNVVITDDDYQYNHDVETDPYPYKDENGVERYKHATKAVNWAPGLSVFRSRLTTWRNGIAPKLFGRIVLVD